jgi:hypothetical protein
VDQARQEGGYQEEGGGSMSGRDRFEEALRKIGVEPELSISLTAPRTIHRMRYRNMFGQEIDFSVEHSNRKVLEKDLLGLSPSLIPSNGDTHEPDTSVVRWTEGEQVKAHFTFEEWFKLTSLATPGTWWYLASPEAYAEAHATYLKLDPLKRIMGAGANLSLMDLLEGKGSKKKGKKP